MKNPFFLLIFSLIVISCSKKTILKSTSTTTAVKQSVNEASAAPQQENIAPTQSDNSANIPTDIDHNLIAKISRTPCFGRCPVFTIELFKDGKATYKGLTFVEKKGNFMAKASPEFIKNIQDKALLIKYLSLENKYPIIPVYITDLPTTTTYIRLGNTGKLISDNYDAPPQLIEFENWLEHEFEKLDWKQ